MFLKRDDVNHKCKSSAGVPWQIPPHKIIREMNQNSPRMEYTGRVARTNKVVNQCMI